MFDQLFSTFCWYGNSGSNLYITEWFHGLINHIALTLFSFSFVPIRSNSRKESGMYSYYLKLGVGEEWWEMFWERQHNNGIILIYYHNILWYYIKIYIICCSFWGSRPVWYLVNKSSYCQKGKKMILHQIVNYSCFSGTVSKNRTLRSLQHPAARLHKMLSCAGVPR